MKYVIAILILIYFTGGALIIPQNDFSTLVDLPGMYRHCKATEDKDMTPFDFITDHLLNLDGLFDKHDNGDEQKPHIPQRMNHQPKQNSYFIHQAKILTCSPVTRNILLQAISDRINLSEHTAKVFRPPIA